MFTAVWSALSNFGCDSELLPPAELKRIRFANQSSLIIGAVVLLYVPIFGLLVSSSLAWVTLALTFCFLAIPFLNQHFQGSILVRHLFLLLNYGSVFFYSLKLGRGTGIQLFFLSAIAAPFVLLDLRRKRRAFFFASLTILLLGFLELWGYEHVTPFALSPEAQRFIYLVSLPSTALTTFVFSGYFYIVNQQSEAALRRTIKDLHHSKKLIEDHQVRLASASRLSAIGELSGSIAHEINNPLAIILGYTEQISRLLQFETIDRDRVMATCEKIGKTINRITKIVLGLRKLSREGGDDPMEAADLVSIIDDATSVCTESLYHAGIQLKIVLPQESCVCTCRPLQISQVLLNLIQNAKDAVQLVEDKWIMIEVRSNPQYFSILVQDSGRITDPEVIEKLGQPFFTTKPPGKGTGLGLSISRRILAAHGGSIEFDPAASSTTFVLQLPRQPA